MGISNLLSMAESVVSAEGYSYVWAVVITGLAVVFIGLIILIAFVWIMGKFFSMGDGKKKISTESDRTTAPVKTTPVRKVETNTANDDEVIAVIAAAVAAMGQAEGKVYKVKSVRAVKNRASRSAWAMAGLQSNTTPF